jgi:hypothetical protein
MAGPINTINRVGRINTTMGTVSVAGRRDGGPGWLGEQPTKVAVLFQKKLKLE